MLESSAVCCEESWFHPDVYVLALHRLLWQVTVESFNQNGVRKGVDRIRTYSSELRQFLLILMTLAPIFQTLAPSCG